eukprot:Protomagalhaensia_wolfi_Nauph_80__3302@NODE_335_length_2758_cov_33_853623_g252_i0_p3_GENE_NODE_335_length_2758_cov_33_853623_g252_i0NODE_335_length_2758_cov_33_853623_g252_i0_p3_ORF_typecomplete_len236_score13_43_NODE_335_length_2758_cov_33_853623_g252_i010291736
MATIVTCLLQKTRTQHRGGLSWSGVLCAVSRMLHKALFPFILSGVLGQEYESEIGLSLIDPVDPDCVSWECQDLPFSTRPIALESISHCWDRKCAYRTGYHARGFVPTTGRSLCADFQYDDQRLMSLTLISMDEGWISGTFAEDYLSPKFLIEGNGRRSGNEDFRVFFGRVDPLTPAECLTTFERYVEMADASELEWHFNGPNTIALDLVNRPATEFYYYVHQGVYWEPLMHESS